MAVAVVVLLEMIDIDHQQPEGCAAANRLGPLVVEPHIHVAPVEQTSQPVPAGQRLELAVGPGELGTQRGDPRHGFHLGLKHLLGRRLGKKIVATGLDGHDQVFGRV